MKKIVLIIAFSLIALLSGGLYFYFKLDLIFEKTAFFEIVTTLTAVFGIVGVIYQADKTKKIEEAKFIFELNKEYLTNFDNQKVLDIFTQTKNIVMTDEIKTMVYRYLDFFEPIYIFILKKNVSIDVIDELFCFRFFSIINNRVIQKEIITPNKIYYKNLVSFHNIWWRYRKKKNKIVPFEESDLSLLDWYSEILA